MKKIFPGLVLILLLVNACSKEDAPKLETFSQEAFAFDLGDGSWEINSTVRIKGFNQTEKNDKFSASIEYVVDLVKPEGDTVKSVYSNIMNQTEAEKIGDLALEAQFELDSTFEFGSYKVLYTVKDRLSKQTAAATINLQLGEE
ncbi:MAG: hypothetical protein HXY49_11120 [Ignavibacteriaceae bacterium]|jgi:hypothetical protein|nr:hypothetical protein [Ignavibacteriaceae bacterium]